MQDLAHFADDVSEDDPPRFTVIQDDSSSIVSAQPLVTEATKERIATSTRCPTMVDEALRLAVKLAVDGGDYDGAATLIEAAKRIAPKTATVVPIDSARDRR